MGGIININKSRTVNIFNSMTINSENLKMRKKLEADNVNHWRKILSILRGLASKFRNDEGNQSKQL